MHLGYAWRLIRTWLVWLIVGAILGAAAGFAYFLANRTYTTSAYLAVTPGQTQTGIRAVNPERFFETAIQTVLADPVMDASARNLGDGTTPAALRKATSLSGGAQSDILKLTVEGASAEQSEQRVRAILASLQASPPTEFSTNLLWVGESAVKTGRVLTVGGGLAAGLFAALLLLLLWGAAKRPVLDPRYTQVPAGVDVYPDTIVAGSPDYERRIQQLRAWLGDANVVEIDPVVPGPASDAVATDLGTTPHEGRPTTTLVLTPVRKSDEDTLGRAIARHAPKTDRVAVAVVDGKGVARRGTQPAEVTS